MDLQERATGYLEAVREADCRGNAHGRRSSRGASSSTSSAGAAPVTVLDENGANLGPPTMTGAAPLGVLSPTPTRPPAPDTSMPASVDPFENSMSKGTRIVDLEAFLPKISKHMCCRFCAEARLKQYLRVFAAYYDRHLEALDLWKWNKHKRPDPEEVSRSFIARRNASGATSYKHIPSHEIIKEVPYGLASVLLFRCSGLSIRGSVSGFTHIGGNRHRFTACTSQRVHKSGLTPTASFVVNQRIALAAMANGKMAGEMHNLLATMDVPLRQNFAFKGRTWLPGELAVGKAIETVADESCVEALEVEVQLTVAAKKAAAAKATAEAAVLAERAAVANEKRRLMASLFGESDAESDGSERGMVDDESSADNWVEQVHGASSSDESSAADTEDDEVAEGESGDDREEAPEVGEPDEAVKRCLAQKSGFSLSAWREHNRALIQRKQLANQKQAQRELAMASEMLRLRRERANAAL